MRKKVLIGTTVTALALAMGITAYAASYNTELHDNVSMQSGDSSALYFDDLDTGSLPDGTTYRSEIDFAGEGAVDLTGEDFRQDEIVASEDATGAISFEDIDADNLPDGVTYQESISLNGDAEVDLSAD